MKVYLSSSSFANTAGGEDLLPFRQELKERALQYGVEVILGEDPGEIKKAYAAGDHLRILEICASLIGRSDAFFGMIFERFGTQMNLGSSSIEARAEVSFFEAELLAACFSKKPVLVVQARGYEPSPAMQEFLRLVQTSLGKHLVTVERNSIAKEFDEFCQAVQRQEVKAKWLHDSVCNGRVWRSRSEELIDPKLSFLGNSLREKGSGMVNPNTIESALARAEAGVDDAGNTLGHLARLTYVWAAIRELAKADVADRTKGALNTQLQNALSLWNKSAAWHGLHGAHPMGCLATLNELNYARMAASQDNPPHHPRASAYYSIGGLMRTKENARHFYKQSLRLCAAGMARRNPNRPLLRQQRASAQARLALIGEPWRYFHALIDYQFCLDHWNKEGASHHKAADALSEYAYALHFLPWKLKEAISMMREGFKLLEGMPETKALGFYLRSGRKLAEMLTKSGQLDEAFEIATQVKLKADATETFDQSRQLEKVIERILLAKNRSGSRE